MSYLLLYNTYCRGWTLYIIRVSLSVYARAVRKYTENRFICVRTHCYTQEGTLVLRIFVHRVYFSSSRSSACARALDWDRLRVSVLLGPASRLEAKSAVAENRDAHASEESAAAGMPNDLRLVTLPASSLGAPRGPVRVYNNNLGNSACARAGAYKRTDIADI